MADDKKNPKPIPSGPRELKRAVKKGKETTNLQKDLESKVGNKDPKKP